LSGATTIPANEARGCNWFAQRWIDASVFLGWAKRSEGSADDYALSNALSHAKHTVCRIIDGLILGNHLGWYIERNYPQKIEGLGLVDISVPSIVHELIIDPRNQLEHDYLKPEPGKVEHAIQVAELFLGAMREELRRPPIIALAWNVQCAHAWKVRSDRVDEAINVHGFTPDPMLFIDVFEKPAQVKLVYPKDQEISYAYLKDFAPEECVRLAKKLREHYVNPSGFSSTSVFFYEEVKRQARI
jgi:hypothetical protein